MQTLNYVEKADRDVKKSVQADDEVADNAIKDTADEIDSEATQTPKKQKREGTDNK
ncbi:hypothetical protein CASFOL_022952 [Castilleja foliolosa]|uniref:Uncharacterized protein n=1 Tax=Castilleja foliolosa TaxID=1961234 RepID=A0ABD3CX03_9LAMI